MRALIVSAVLLAIAPAYAANSDARILRSLKSLDPAARLEQLCDYTALQYIRKNARTYRPDRALAGAISDPKIKGDSVEVTGGAFRSRKRWYEMKYSCTASPDHLQVLSFKLTIGEEIPESKWASYGLWQ